MNKYMKRKYKPPWKESPDSLKWVVHSSQHKQYFTTVFLISWDKEGGVSKLSECCWRPHNVGVAVIPSYIWITKQIGASLFYSQLGSDVLCQDCKEVTSFLPSDIVIYQSALLWQWWLMLMSYLILDAPFHQIIHFLWGGVRTPLERIGLAAELG